MILSCSFQLSYCFWRQKYVLIFFFHLFLVSTLPLFDVDLTHLEGLFLCVIEVAGLSYVELRRRLYDIICTNCHRVNLFGLRSIPFAQQVEYEIRVVFGPVDGVIDQFSDIENKRLLRKLMLCILVTTSTKDLPPIH